MSGTEERPRGEWRFGAAAATAILIFLILFFTPHHVDQQLLPKWKAKTIEQPHHVDQAPWLVATMSPAGGIGRRIVIRETWQRLYANASRFDMRFIISNASDLWWPHIQQENKTYGDLLMMENLPETRKVANSIKPMEFFKSLVDGEKLRPYSFVSKIDDDTFLDATRFYDRYLAPRLEAARDNHMQLSPSVIGRKIRGSYTWDYPGGAFYTLSWDLVCAAVKVYKFNGTQSIKDEDALTGKLVADTKLQFEFVGMPFNEAFDYITPEGRVWAKNEEQLDTYFHALAPGAIWVHNLKSTEFWMQISEAFDKNGLREDVWRQHVDVGNWYKNRTLTSSSSRMSSTKSTAKTATATLKSKTTTTKKAKAKHTTKAKAKQKSSFTSVTMTSSSSAFNESSLTSVTTTTSSSAVSESSLTSVTTTTSSSAVNESNSPD